MQMTAKQNQSAQTSATQSCKQKAIEKITRQFVDSAETIGRIPDGWPFAHVSRRDVYSSKAFLKEVKAMVQFLRTERDFKFGATYPFEETIALTLEVGEVGDEDRYVVYIYVSEEDPVDVINEWILAEGGYEVY